MMGSRAQSSALLPPLLREALEVEEARESCASPSQLSRLWGFLLLQGNWSL